MSMDSIHDSNDYIFGLPCVEQNIEHKVVQTLVLGTIGPKAKLSNKVATREDFSREVPRAINYENIQCMVRLA